MLLYTTISCLVLRSARVNVMASHLSLVDLMLWFMSDGFVPMRFEVMVYAEVSFNADSFRGGT